MLSSPPKEQSSSRPSSSLATSRPSQETSALRRHQAAAARLLVRAELAMIKSVPILCRRKRPILLQLLLQRLGLQFHHHLYHLLIYQLIIPPRLSLHLKLSLLPQALKEPKTPIRVPVPSIKVEHLSDPIQVFTQPLSSPRLEDQSNPVNKCFQASLDLEHRYVAKPHFAYTIFPRTSRPNSFSGSLAHIQQSRAPTVEFLSLPRKSDSLSKLPFALLLCSIHTFSEIPVLSILTHPQPRPFLFECGTKILKGDSPLLKATLDHDNAVPTIQNRDRQSPPKQRTLPRRF
ncbi:hypothetical protein K435DRAFT_963738 [Dendrothele bispora CBS 962.96]|uniref:Uncharacterized protein n=1 Tax=Dendrothele bispora (strain CBS 962.96) TaxID=1314807 RepID=A0A4S8MG38_DENBC|nr:hypothetical protein K435DRAFT_963738 [Dendrothele bispora CBS 962.96]